jgi:dihydrofolate synthase/folylpolyglutamate synthase
VTPRDYLFSLEQFGIKLGLAQITALLDQLGRPDRAYPSLLVAGTNGKGSVTAMTERALRAAGRRTGRYTSPHLVQIEERVAIDGQPIEPGLFDDIAAGIQRAAARLPVPPTFFEATTALALEAFRRRGVDIAVMEVGLGGRLDATNVLLPEGVAITAIDFDHEQHLGHTLEAIAREKAGIVKPGRFCVLGANAPEVRQLVADRCRDVGADFVFAPDEVESRAAAGAGRLRLTLRTPAADYGEIALGLRGRHQIDNCVTAVRLLEQFARAASVDVGVDAIRTGLRDVEWPARLEVRRFEGAEVLIDGAHNPAAARALADYLRDTYPQRLPIVIGVMRDKNIRGILAPLAERASAFICTAPASPRAETPDALAAIARDLAPDLPVRAIAGPRAALIDALSLGAPAVVAGSLYLAGEIRAELT